MFGKLKHTQRRLHLRFEGTKWHVPCTEVAPGATVTIGFHERDTSADDEREALSSAFAPRFPVARCAWLCGFMLLRRYGSRHLLAR